MLSQADIGIRIQSLKKLIEMPYYLTRDWESDHAEAWKLIRRSNNLSLILDNFEAFLPCLNHDYTFITRREMQRVNRFNKLFEIYSIISLYRPELFLNIIKQGTPNNAYFPSLLYKLFDSGYKRSTPFEIALIINEPQVCQSIINLYSTNMPYNLGQNSVYKTLLDCQRLNSIFNAPQDQGTAAELISGLNIRSFVEDILGDMPLNNLLRNLPNSCHSKLLRLVYTVYPVAPFVLRSISKRQSFKKFVPQFIALRFGIAPLSTADEDNFLECMHTYFSLSSTCTALHIGMTTKTKEVPTEFNLIICHLAMTNYQNNDFTKCMFDIYPLIRTCTKPNNLLNFCESFLSPEEINFIPNHGLLVEILQQVFATDNVSIQVHHR